MKTEGDQDPPSAIGSRGNAGALLAVHVTVTVKRGPVMLKFTDLVAVTVHLRTCAPHTNLKLAVSRTTATAPVHDRARRPSAPCPAPTPPPPLPPSPAAAPPRPPSRPPAPRPPTSSNASYVLTHALHTPTLLPSTAAKLTLPQRQSAAYPAHLEPRIAAELHQATSHYPTLHAILDSFTTSTGSSTPLVALRGTVPVRYKGGHYKIPVHVWLMPYHPSGPPLAFVVPTRNMVFRAAHPHVDAANGLVYLPYLSDWRAPDSSLLGLVRALVDAFEVKPPVYAKLPAPRSPDSRRLVERLTARVRAALEDRAQARCRDAKLAREASRRLLLDRRAQLHAAEELRASLQARLDELRGTARALRRWVALHPSVVGVDVDAQTRYRHALREQEAGCRARDAALTDAMDAADEAVGKRVVGVEEYVRAVRWIAREQFFERLMLGKARRRVGLLKDAARAGNVAKEDGGEPASRKR